MHDETSIEQRGAGPAARSLETTAEQRRVIRAASVREDAERSHDAEEMPRVRFTRRRLLASVMFVVSTVAFLYFVLPAVLGLRDTWNRIQHGNVWWLALAVLLEVCSFCGYIALFRAVFVRGDSRIGWRASYQITMAGLAATRLFASAGAGGIALTAWALRAVRAGAADRRVPDDRLPGAAVRRLHGHARDRRPRALPRGVPGAGAVRDHGRAGDLRRRRDRDLPRRLAAAGRLRPARQALDCTEAAWAGSRVTSRPRRRRPPAACGPRSPSCATRDVYLLGAPAWWGFDIAVLWACFHAFGGSPPTAVIVMSYFVGMLGNALPLPGGIGGVDGGMIGAFSAFGVPVQLAVVAVLAYRAIRVLAADAARRSRLSAAAADGHRVARIRGAKLYLMK